MQAITQVTDFRQRPPQQPSWHHRQASINMSEILKGFVNFDRATAGFEANAGHENERMRQGRAALPHLSREV
jgi:hypothetical protein